MAEAGILHEDDRIELIDGRLIVMEPIGWPHVHIVNRLNRLFVERSPHEVSPQNPIRLTDYTEPQPDLVLLDPKRTLDAPIFGPHAFLVVEVAETSLAYDRGVKLTRYAEAGVPQVWIVDVNRRQIEVYRQPDGSAYLSKVIAAKGELAIPDGGKFSLDEVFGPPKDQ